MSTSSTILFTAFEPSGDALAAPLIAELLQRRPGLKVYALGGPKMAEAGAELIETTTEHATMLIGAAAEAWTHKKRLDRLKRWLGTHPIDALVPTDSPAANWSICALVKKTQPKAKVVHLVCPQVWAWATWRVKKLRRLTDHVLCLLPYEVDFLAQHGVAGTFVGHPLFESIAPAAPRSLEGLGESEGPRLALLPGSRSKEIRRNWPTMLAAFEQLAARHPGLSARVALRVAGDEAKLREAGELPGAAAGAAGRSGARIEVCHGRTDEVIAWSDAVLVVSGTATLQVLVHRRPMVVIFRVGEASWKLVGRLLIKTRTFSLPNLISESMGMGRVVTEFVPHFGAVGPVVEAMTPLLRSSEARSAQIEAFETIAARFGAVRFKDTAAARLLAVAG